MNLILPVTTLALVAAADGRLSAPHALLGAEQLSFLGTPCEGCAPDYCYPKYEDPDYDCYRDGYPKCCSKSKGNCPNDVENKPGCECLPGSCNGGEPVRGEKCKKGDDSFQSCKGHLFCQTPEGLCGEQGRCQDMTVSCDRSSKQVCGCNGVTYDNECAAFSVGVSVDYDRPCDSPPAEGDFCWLDHGPDTCGASMFCAVGMGDCQHRTGRVPGECRPYGETCTASYDPVCGCDGKTYDNAGCAQAQGINVQWEGTCEREPCTYYGVNDSTCSKDSQFCRLENGDCTKRVASQSGHCGIMPTTCSYDYKPVCGCDSKTHANECVARSHGVNVMHDGEC